MNLLYRKRGSLQANMAPFGCFFVPTRSGGKGAVRDGYSWIVFVVKDELTRRCTMNPLIIELWYSRCWPWCHWPSPAAAALVLDIRIGPPQPYRFTAPPDGRYSRGLYLHSARRRRGHILLLRLLEPSFRGTLVQSAVLQRTVGVLSGPERARRLLQLLPNCHSVPSRYRRIPFADLRKKFRKRADCRVRKR